MTATVRAVLARGGCALVAAGRGDDPSAGELGGLHDEATERARRAHDERGLAGGELRPPDESERQRRVTHDDRRLSERQLVGDVVHVLGGDAHVVGVTAPAMDADVALPAALLRRAGAAPIARPARDRVVDDDRVADLPGGDAVAHGLDHAGGIDAEDVRHREAREIRAAAHPQAVGAVHRDGSHSDEDLAG